MQSNHEDKESLTRKTYKTKLKSCTKLNPIL